MRFQNLETGEVLSAPDLEKWLIQRSRFLMGRKIPERSPEEFLKEEEKYRGSLNAYITEETKLLRQMKEQIDLRDQEIERLKKQLHNQYRILDSMETRVGEERQENNELRKRLSPVTGPAGQ